MKKTTFCILLLSLVLNLIFIPLYFYLLYTKEPVYPRGKYYHNDVAFFGTEKFEVHIIEYDLESQISIIKEFAHNIINCFIENEGEIHESIANYISMPEAKQEYMKLVFERWIENASSRLNIRITAVKIYIDKAIVDFDFSRGVSKPGSNENKLFLEYQNDKWVVVDFFEPA